MYIYIYIYIYICAGILQFRVQTRKRGVSLQALFGRRGPLSAMVLIDTHGLDRVKSPRVASSNWRLVGLRVYKYMAE